MHKTVGLKNKIQNLENHIQLYGCFEKHEIKKEMDQLKKCFFHTNAQMQFDPF